MKKARVGLIIDNNQPWNIFDLIKKSYQSDTYEISS